MYLQFNEEHYCTASEHEPEKYGSWYAHYDFSHPTRAWEGGVNKYGAYPYVGPVPEKGDSLYVIIALWSSGDSFGHGTNSDYEILLVNNSRERAEANLAKINALDDGKFSYSDNNAICELDDGSTMKVYTGAWKGYFESLTSLGITEVKFDS